MRWPFRSWKLQASKIRMTSSRNVLGRALLELALEGGRKIVGELIDLLGGGENLLRRLRGTGGDGVELWREAAHLRLLAAPW